MKELLCIFLFLIFFDFNLLAQNQNIDILCIDAGHGGDKPGAVFGQYKEKDIALKVSLEFGKLIKFRFPWVKIYYTRMTDKYVYQRERADIANRNNADLFISIHVNSSNQQNTGLGTETLIYGRNTGRVTVYSNTEPDEQTIKNETEDIKNEERYEQLYNNFINKSDNHFETQSVNNMSNKSFEFASIIENKYRTLAGRESRHVKVTDEIYVLYGTNMPAVLTEIGFINNVADRNFLVTNNGQKKIAESLLEAFTEYKYLVENNGSWAVQLSASKAQVNLNTILWQKIQNLEVRYLDGWYKYYAGGYSTQSDAQRMISYFKSLGFNDAFVKKL